MSSATHSAGAVELLVVLKMDVSAPNGHGESPPSMMKRRLAQSVSCFYSNLWAREGIEDRSKANPNYHARLEKRSGQDNGMTGYIITMDTRIRPFSFCGAESEGANCHRSSEHQWGHNRHEVQ